MPERADEIRALADEMARRHGLAQLPTRMAVELRPPVPLDKGSATRELVRGFDVGAFAGDDTGDLPAFAALARAGLTHAVRIGVHSPEAPPELIEAVDLLVDGPAGLAALLGRVADEIA
jgi:trehalose-6-phosphatase